MAEVRETREEVRGVTEVREVRGGARGVGEGEYQPPNRSTRAPTCLHAAATASDCRQWTKGRHISGESVGAHP